MRVNRNELKPQASITHFYGSMFDILRFDIPQALKPLCWKQRIVFLGAKRRRRVYADLRIPL
jgi:hypothetical protein